MCAGQFELRKVVRSCFRFDLAVTEWSQVVHGRIRCMIHVCIRFDAAIQLANELCGSVTTGPKSVIDFNKWLYVNSVHILRSCMWFTLHPKPNYIPNANTNTTFFSRRHNYRWLHLLWLSISNKTTCVCALTTFVTFTFRENVFVFIFTSNGCKWTKRQVQKMK